MADEDQQNEEGAEGAGGGGGDGGGAEAAKCPECPPPGAPAWMATFSDLVTLLLTFFVLLLSFAKTETAKYEAALGSVRNAFGGNVLKQGEVIQRGKSPDDSPTMIESTDVVRPFPIDFLTMEGLLNKHEINRESDEDLKEMKSDLKSFDLSESVNIEEMPEGIKVRIKDAIYFKEGSLELDQMVVEVFSKLVKLLAEKKWVVFVEGHASKGESSPDGSKDAWTLSAMRAMAVGKALIKRGVRPEQVNPIFYGDTRPNEPYKGGGTISNKEDVHRRVEFVIRKRDLRKSGHFVSPY